MKRFVRSRHYCSYCREDSLGRAYPAGVGWDACTGFGSVKGVALQNALQAAHAGARRLVPAYPLVPAHDPLAYLVLIQVGTARLRQGLMPLAKPCLVHGPVSITIVVVLEQNSVGREME